MTSNEPFDTFKSLAFRLEALPDYPVDGGPAPDFLHYLSTGSVPSGHNGDWAEMIRTARQRGAKVQRLRLVSDPLSAYERFELEKGYGAGVRVGEEIRVALKPVNFKEPDFWAYDGALLEVLDYSAAGEYRGSDVRKMTAADREMFLLWKRVFDSALHLEAYRASLGI